MFYIDKITGKKIWKYDLVDEALAAASAGMSATTGLDKRSVIFTIHLTHASNHKPLCQVLFDTAESYFINKSVKRRSASYTGLASFIDVTGSKFSGADRDHTQVHCHGCIFLPWSTSPSETTGLISQLKLVAFQRSRDGQALVKSSANAIDFRIFDFLRTDANLKIWTQYAQKETARIEATEDGMVFLPFDTRTDYGAKVANQITNKRDKTLTLLRSDKRFKILQYL